MTEKKKINHEPKNGIWAIVENGIVTQTQPTVSQDELKSGKFTDLAYCCCGQLVDKSGNISNPVVADADILEQIEDLERKQTPRMIREAALGDRSRLQEIEGKIKALRAKL